MESALALRNVQLMKLTDSRDKSNASTSNKTANDHHCQSSGSGLKNATNDESKATRDNGPSSTNAVSNVAGDDSAKECTAGED